MYTFIHIPKTAGSSIRHHIKELDNISLRNHHVDFGKIDVTKLGVNCVENPDTIMFAVVRNPYDRFISAYNYIMNGGYHNGNDTQNFILIKDLLLDEFLDRINDFKEKVIHFVPQYYFIDSRVNIIKFEEKEEGLKAYGINLNKHLNKSKNKFITELTDEQKEKVYEAYKEDFEMFGYEK